MGKVGIPGIICMPLKKNTKGVLSNWRVVKCPKCGRECYERWTIVNKVDTIYKEKVPSTAT